MEISRMWHIRISTTPDVVGVLGLRAKNAYKMIEGIPVSSSLKEIPKKKISRCFFTSKILGGKCHDAIPDL